MYAKDHLTRLKEVKAAENVYVDGDDTQASVWEVL